MTAAPDASNTAGASCGATDASATGDAPATCTTPAATTSDYETGQVFVPIPKLRDCCDRPFDTAASICSAKLTLVLIGAGWCEACAKEAATIMDDIVKPFVPRGLEVIQILYEPDNPGDVATTSFCVTWRDTFKLGFPVVTDPFKKSGAVFKSVGSKGLPVTLVVDSNFVVQYRFTGGAPSELEAWLDAHLPK